LQPALPQTVTPAAASDPKIALGLKLCLWATLAFLASCTLGLVICGVAFPFRSRLLLLGGALTPALTFAGTKIIATAGKLNFLNVAGTKPMRSSLITALAMDGLGMLLLLGALYTVLMTPGFSSTDTKALAFILPALFMTVAVLCFYRFLLQLAETHSFASLKNRARIFIWTIVVFFISLAISLSAPFALGALGGLLASALLAAVALGVVVLTIFHALYIRDFARAMP